MAVDPTIKKHKIEPNVILEVLFSFFLLIFQSNQKMLTYLTKMCLHLAEIDSLGQRQFISIVDCAAGMLS